jgi:hypothetical protein
MVKFNWRLNNPAIFCFLLLTLFSLPNESFAQDTMSAEEAAYYDSLAQAEMNMGVDSALMDTTNQGPPPPPPWYVKLGISTRVFEILKVVFMIGGTILIASVAWVLSTRDRGEKN